MKNKSMKDYARLLEKKMGKEQSDAIIKDAQIRFEELVNANLQESKEVKAHTVEKIYPTIGLYESLLKHGMDKEKAVSIVDDLLCTIAQGPAKQFRAILKFPGLYRLLPRIYRWMTVNNFGEKAGFKASFYQTDSSRCKFDMTRCTYCEYLKKYGHPEIISCFCHTDDVTTGNMHPKLCWNRTKTMGEGADVCDFDIFIKK